MASDKEEMSTGMMCNEASRWEVRATGDDEVVVCDVVVATTTMYTCVDSKSGDSSSQSCGAPVVIIRRVHSVFGL